MAEMKPPPKMPKWILDAQVFLLRRQWMGPMNRQLMVITTMGRKSGKAYSVPVGFAPDGNNYLTFNIEGKSNWYKNVLSNPMVTLEVQGKKIRALGEPVKTPEALRKVVEVYKRERPEMFERFFQVSPDLPTDELVSKVSARIVFTRFRPA